MMGWLHAVPQPPSGTGRARAAEPNKLSRLERMRREGVTPQMPPNPAPKFIAWFIEIGMIESGGMGPSVLTWGEIRDWQYDVGIHLAPWEARLMRKLSAEYIAEMRRAESENRPAPWRGKVTQSEINAELAALERVLG